MEALSSRLPPRQIVAGINARFFRGRPSTSLAEAGVLIHIFDNQGDLDGHMYERPGFSETFYSTSVITYRKPQIWNSRKHEDGGLIMAANTEILCGFDHDQGTGGQRNGGCPESWSPEQTLQVLRSGEPATAYWINEFIVGRQYWESHFVDALEAFVITHGAGEAVRNAHRNHLQKHGKCASQVPLVRYYPPKCCEQLQIGADAFVDVSPPPPDGSICATFLSPSCITGRSLVPGWYGFCDAIREMEACKRSYAWSNLGEPIPCTWDELAGGCRMNPGGCKESPPQQPPAKPPPSPPPPACPPPPPSPPLPACPPSPLPRAPHVPPAWPPPESPPPPKLLMIEGGKVVLMGVDLGVASGLPVLVVFTLCGVLTFFGLTFHLGSRLGRTSVSAEDRHHGRKQKRTTPNAGNKDSERSATTKKQQKPKKQMICSHPCPMPRAARKATGFSVGFSQVAQQEAPDVHGADEEGAFVYELD